MITLSVPEGLLVIYLFLIPVYIGIAGWSFKFYSLKSNSTPKEIEDFQNQLRFPANSIFRENSVILKQILGKGFISSDLSRAKFQRILILILLSVLHIPVFIGMLSVNNFFDILYSAIFLFTSIITMVICMRFGHSLLSKSDSK